MDPGRDEKRPVLAGDIRCWRGLWLPKKEQHLPRFIARTGYHKRDGFLTYQYRKYKAALPYVKNHRVALDIGAHVGQWSRVMAMDFGRVEAFEPVPLYRKCWLKNLEGVGNASCKPVALGEKSQLVSLENVTPGSYGDTRVTDGSDTTMWTLDSFGFEDIDFIKIDCEGYERFVLEGAVETLKKCRPTMVVEQKKGHGAHFGYGDTAAVGFLEGLGAKVREAISGDYILSW